jgi:hypothetical protein
MLIFDNSAFFKGGPNSSPAENRLEPGACRSNPVKLSHTKSYRLEGGTWNKVETQFGDVYANDSIHPLRLGVV